MLNQKMIEKQLSYSGYDISWLENSVLTNETGTNWETITSYLPGDAIIYSLCVGKYFGSDACIIATNSAIYGIYIDPTTNKIDYSVMSYTQIDKIAINRSKNGKAVLVAAIGDQIQLGLEVENELAATHMRTTIINEINSKNSLNVQFDTNFKSDLEQKIQRHREKVGEIEYELDLEPQNHEHAHRTFAENFKKIKTVYHIRRIIFSMMILWVIVFGFATYLITWRIRLYVIGDNLQSNILVLSPTIADLFTIIFCSGILGCVIFLYIYQKHLRNIIVNALCYILFVLLAIMICSCCIPLLETVIMAARITNGDTAITAEPVPKVIRITGLYTGIITFVSALCVFGPLITLNIGIYRNNKVK